MDGLPFSWVIKHYNKNKLRPRTIDDRPRTQFNDNCKHADNNPDVLFFPPQEFLHTNSTMSYMDKFITTE